MSDFSKSVFWTVIAIGFIGIIFVTIVIKSDMFLPPTMSKQAKPLPKQAVAQQQTPVPFVVFPKKFVGNFLLGMSKRDVLKIAPKPQEKSADRLMYKNQKTGNILIAHFQKNRLVQIDFTSKDFYTEEGIHPGNFRDAQYTALFDVQEVPGTPLQLKYTLKTGGLTFYSNPDALSHPVGVVHEGPQPTYAVQPMQMTAPARSAQITESAQQAERLARLRKGIEGTQAQTPALAQPTQPTAAEIDAAKVGAARLLYNLLQNVQNATTPAAKCMALQVLYTTSIRGVQAAGNISDPDTLNMLRLFETLQNKQCAEAGISPSSR